MKKYFSISMALSVVFTALVAYYYNEVDEARLTEMMDIIGGVTTYTSGGQSENLTEEIALLSLLFIGAFIALDYLKMKSSAEHKKFAIVGLFLSVVLLVWDLLVLSSPGHMSFDEVAPAWGLYGLTMFIFARMGMRKHNRTLTN